MNTSKITATALTFMTLWFAAGACPAADNDVSALPPIGQKEKIRFFWSQWWHFKMPIEQTMANLQRVGATVFADWQPAPERAKQAHDHGIRYFTAFATAQIRDEAETMKARLAVDLTGKTCLERFADYVAAGGERDKPWGSFGEGKGAYVPCPLERGPWDEALKPIMDLARQGHCDGLHLDLEAYGAYGFDHTGETLCYCDDCFGKYLEHRNLEAEVERKDRHDWLKKQGKLDDYLTRLRQRMVTMCQALAAELRKIDPTFAFSIYPGFSPGDVRSSWRSEGMAIGLHAPKAPFIVVDSVPYWEDPTRPWWDGAAEAYRKLGIKHVMGSWDVGIMLHHKESHVGASQLMYELSMATDGFWRWGERDYDVNDWRSFAMVNQRLRRLESRLGEFLFGGRNVRHFVTLVEQTGAPAYQRPLTARTWERDGRHLIRIFNGNTDWPIHVRVRFPRISGAGPWRLSDPVYEVNYVQAGGEAAWSAESLHEGAIVPIEGRDELYLMLEKAPEGFTADRFLSVESMEVTGHRPRPEALEPLPDTDAPVPPGTVLYTDSVAGGYQGETGSGAIVTCILTADVWDKAEKPAPKGLFNLQGYCYDARFAADAKRVVCTVTVNGKGQIYLINTAGGKARNISNNAYFDRAPCFWPDGTRIAFSSDRDGDWEIYSMNADGTDQRRLTDSPGIDRAPAVSPGGKRIAFLSDRESDLDVYVMNADGSDQRPHVPRAGNEDEPTWSPDGEQIACTAQMGNMRPIQLTAADGSEVRLLAHGKATNLRSIRFSPDGTKIAGAYSEYGNSGILVVDLESNEVKKLLDLPSLKPHQQFWYATGTNTPRMVAKTFTGVSFSPDGKTLLYCSDESSDGTFKLYTIAVDGGEPKHLPGTGVSGHGSGAWPMATDWARP